MEIGVIGTGAIGGYYGGRLAQGGHRVHFLLRSDYAQVRDHGLRVESVAGDFTLSKVQAYDQAAQMPVCDLLLVALKTTENARLADLLRPLLKPKTWVILLQNGLTVEEELHACLPEARLLGGLCFICSRKQGPGHIQHLDQGGLRLAPFLAPSLDSPDQQVTRSQGPEAGQLAELNSLVELFNESGIQTRLSTDLRRARWEKLVWNLAFNGPSVLLNARTQALMTNNHSRALVAALMQETIGAARACGQDIKQSFADQLLQVTAAMIDYAPSMKLDYERRQPMEIEQIYWQPINRARAAGYAMPLAQSIAWQLAFLQEHRA